MAFVCRKCGRCCMDVGLAPPSSHEQPSHPDNALPEWFKVLVNNLRKRQTVPPPLERCVFLTDDNLCTVYDLCRPAGCKQHACGGPQT